MDTEFNRYGFYIGNSYFAISWDARDFFSIPAYYRAPKPVVLVGLGFYIRIGSFV